ncbi:MAG TPA: Tex-like N-terminal domain-containing protein, partial [Phycisphaerae bacterium]|nr:Tex-like N-terminal domain-containing protein [Phycisphaerae bacterium]
MSADTSDALAQRLKISRERISPVLELLDAGLSPVFIAHYRKTETRGTDEETIRRIERARRDLAAIESLRRKARAVAEHAGALTEGLAAAIADADDPDILEDLMRPLQPRRRTAGSVARERGLEPLADYASAGAADGPDLAEKAAQFVAPDREVRSPEEAMAGAGHILAERVADDPRLRGMVRRFAWEKGTLRSQQAGPRAKEAAEFRSYFQFAEALSRIPPHRILAINRGERSKALKVTIDVPAEPLMDHVLGIVMPAGHRFAAFLKNVLADALRRLVLPAAERAIRRRLTERAERHAIEVFVANLRSLLMTRPVRGRRVLAVQPGYRTGCKMAMLGPDGALLGETIIYPLEPQAKWDEGKTAVLQALQQHQIETIAIGNGTGCREVEALVSELIGEHSLDARYAIISEAGAAAYADSDLAKQEFGHLDAAIRATVSIGRRLQDPLAELVKIDPRAIGVGLYQHDVNQQHLQRALDETIESCVAAVGADANTASAPMLRRIPGLGDEHLAALLARRAETPIAGRDELKTLPNWNEKVFLLAAGFLRVRGSNPLDATRIHPQWYADAERLLAHLGNSLDDLKGGEKTRALRQALPTLSIEPVAEELAIPLPTLLDIVGALQQPGSDPRRRHHGPIFRRAMRRLQDLQPGMWVKGTVRNVVDFGAFVDIGLKEEGLIHISQFSRRYVRNPMKFLHVGDVVDVRIVAVEADKHRIALTLIPDRPPARREPKARSRPAPPGAAPAGPAAEPRRKAEPARARAADGETPRTAA